MVEIKDIPKEKRSIVLLKDLGDYALYLNRTDNCFAGFEVHKIRIMEATEYKRGNTVYKFPKRRAIASTAEFGHYGWHYPNLEMVFDKYPRFKDYKKEIVRKTEDVRKELSKPIKKREVIETKQKDFLYPVSDKVASIICANCGNENRIVRAYEFQGKNKGKIKPLCYPRMISCGSCGKNMFKKQ